MLTMTFLVSKLFYTSFCVLKKRKAKIYFISLLTRKLNKQTINKKIYIIIMIK